MTKKVFKTIYVVLLHLIIIIILTKSNFFELLKVKVTGQSSEFTRHYQNMVFFHRQIEQSLPKRSVLFIGDSITQGLAVSAITNNAVNYGIGNDTTFGVLKRLPLYGSISDSQAIVLAIGHNDLKLRKTSKIINNFKLILDSLPQKTKIVLSAVLPIDELRVKSSITNDQIKGLNIKLRSVSQGYSNVEFLNISKLISVKGNLLPQYHIGDGIHLSKLGYKVWIDELSKVI